MRLPLRSSHLCNFLLALIPTTSALHLSLHIPATPPILPNPGSLPSTTTATLYDLNNTRTALLRRGNTFDFPDLTPGSYLLTVQARDFVFAPGRVDVVRGTLEQRDQQAQEGKESVYMWRTFFGNEWGNKGPLWDEGTVDVDKDGKGKVVTLEVRPERVREYYTERAGFSPLQFLKSPMILMALFSLVVIVGMPYLMDSMDDETKAEFEEMQSKSTFSKATAQASGRGGTGGWDFASWMAGAGGDGGDGSEGGSGSSGGGNGAVASGNSAGGGGGGGNAKGGGGSRRRG
ncbi:MAG: hypothetical protein M1831_006150 [Alyxoria varia]|nr:MAG: hypothetical protein M1831_006150 [Alyxoria varia]